MLLHTNRAVVPPEVAAEMTKQAGWSRGMEHDLSSGGCRAHAWCHAVPPALCALLAPLRCSLGRERQQPPKVA